MTKYGTIAKRSAALALAGVMACSCAMGVSAASNPAAKRDETVFVTLASDGTVQKATDSVWLHADAGLDGYTEDTGLADITMLKDTEQPSQDGSRLSFSTADTDAYYQGTAGTDLPVSAKITYTLDGTQMTAEQLAGQSGHLVMHIDLTNNSYQMKTVGGVSRRICTPFVTVVTMTLDTDKFAAVKAENGTVQTDSSKDLVAYVCLPGMKECFDGLLNGDLSELNDKLNDEVTLEADVTDFEMPMMYIAASTDASDFSTESELSDFDDLFDELDGLDDKLDEMMDGVDTLLKGSNDLNKGAGDLYTAVNTLNDGAATLQTGAHSAADGAATLSSGLNTLSGNSSTVKGGVAQVKAGVLDSANKQLEPYGVTLTWENYSNILQPLIDAKCQSVSFAPEDYVNAYNGVIDTLKAEPYNLDATGAETVYRYACHLASPSETYMQALQDAGAACTLIKAANEEYQQHSTKPWEITSVAQVCIGAMIQQAGGALTQEQAVATWGASDDSSKEGIYNAILSQARSQDMVVILGSDLLRADSVTYGSVSEAFNSAGEMLTIYNSCIANAPAQDSSNSLLAQALQATMTGTLGSLKSSMDGILALEDGISKYTAGVDSAASGAATLSAGLNTLRDGTDTLKDGTGKLLNGVSTLKDGTGTLVDGVQKLYDGVDEAYDKIQNNTGDISLDDLQDIKDTLEEVKTQRSNYSSFSGSADNTTGSVKFVMKVTAEKQEKEDAPAVETSAQDSGNGNFFANLWQRFVALFRK